MTTSESVAELKQKLILISVLHSSYPDPQSRSYILTVPEYFRKSRLFRQLRIQGYRIMEVSDTKWFKKCPSCDEYFFNDEYLHHLRQEHTRVMDYEYHPDHGITATIFMVPRDILRIPKRWQRYYGILYQIEQIQDWILKVRIDRRACEGCNRKCCPDCITIVRGKEEFDQPEELEGLCDGGTSEPMKRTHISDLFGTYRDLLVEWVEEPWIREYLKESGEIKVYAVHGACFAFRAVVIPGKGVRYCCKPRGEIDEGKVSRCINDWYCLDRSHLLWGKHGQRIQSNSPELGFTDGGSPELTPELIMELLEMEANRYPGKCCEPTPSMLIQLLAFRFPHVAEFQDALEYFHHPKKCREYKPTYRSLYSRLRNILIKLERQGKIARHPGAAGSWIYSPDPQRLQELVEQEIQWLKLKQKADAFWNVLIPLVQFSDRIAARLGFAR